MYSKLPAEPGETPPKVVIETKGEALHRAAMIEAFTRLEGVVGAFQIGCRQQRKLSGQSFYSANQTREDGGQLRYVYNSGQETITVVLNPTEEGSARRVAPQEPGRGTPELAVDIVFEPALYAAEDLFYSSETVGAGGTPGDPSTWNPVHWVDLYFTGDGQIKTSFPAADAINSSDVSGNYFIYVGDDGLNHNGTFEYSRIDTLVSWEVGGAAAAQDLDEHIHDNYAIGIGGSWGDYDSVADPGQQLKYGTPGSLPTSQTIALSVSDRLNADVARIYELGSVTTSQPAGGQQVYTPQNVLTLIEIRYRPPGLKQVEDKVERFDVRNIAALIVDPKDKETYEAVSMGMVTPPTDTDERLAWMDPAHAAIHVARALDAHTAQGKPGTFGAGFLAKMKHPAFGRSSEPVTLEVYVASVNSMASNTAPGPDAAPDREDPDVTRATHRDLKLRIRAREFADAKTVPVEVKTHVGTKTTHAETPGETTVLYDDETTGGGGNAEGGGGLDLSGAGTEDIKWAFAAQEGWADLGGEPSDPTAKRMGSLLADTGPLTRTVAGPADAADTYYTELQWKGTVKQMTKVATIHWQPAVEPGGQGSARIELA